MLDTGALVALERGDARAFQQSKVAADRGFLVVVPTSVVMEALSGSQGPQRVFQVLKEIKNELPLEPAVSHEVVPLRRKAVRDSGIETIGETDTIVVLEALPVPGSAILSDHREDVLALIAAAGAAGRVPVLTVSPVRR